MTDIKTPLSAAGTPGRLIFDSDGNHVITADSARTVDLIVKCVNTHEELVDVLDSVLEGIKRGYNLGYLEDEVEKVLEKAGAL